MSSTTGRTRKQRSQRKQRKLDARCTRRNAAPVPSIARRVLRGLGRALYGAFAASAVTCSLVFLTLTLLLHMGEAGATGTTFINALQLVYTATGSGAVQVKLIQLLGQENLVYYYGAACNNSTDDQASVQNALNAASGVPAVLPAGKTCVIASQITFPQNGALVGKGMATSVLKYTGNATFAILINSVSGWRISNVEISATGSSSSKGGVQIRNTTAANLRGKMENVWIVGDQSPPVSGTYGVEIWSSTGFSLYNIDFDHVEVTAWDKGFYSHGDTGSGGANDNKWWAPQVDNCITGFDFQNVAGPNWVRGLHCNGGGQAFDQLCLNIGDGANNTAGNSIEMYVDNAVSGHVGKSFNIANGSIRNWITSYSGSTQGTDLNSPGTTTRNVILEMNAASGRVTYTVGNVQLISDGAIGGLYVSPTASTGMGILQSNINDVATSIGFRLKANATITNPSARMFQVFNGVDTFDIDPYGMPTFNASSVGLAASAGVTGVGGFGNFTSNGPPGQSVTGTTGAATAGNGSAVTITAGRGGDASGTNTNNNTAGNGGSMVFSGGDSGSATNSSATNQQGVPGSLSFFPGKETTVTGTVARFAAIIMRKFGAGYNASGSGFRMQAERYTVGNRQVAPVDCAGGPMAPTTTTVLGGGMFTCATAQTLTLPTPAGSAGLVQNLPGTPAVGDIFEFMMSSTAAANFTLAGSAGDTIVGAAVTNNTSRIVRCRVTSVTSGSETVSCY